MNNEYKINMFEQPPTEAILSQVENTQQQYAAAKAESNQKLLGQYFTGSSVAKYMATLVHSSTPHLRILDAGAGCGILTAATTLQCLARGAQSVHAVTFELDENVIDELTKTLEVYFACILESWSAVHIRSCQ